MRAESDIVEAAVASVLRDGDRESHGLQAICTAMLPPDRCPGLRPSKDTCTIISGVFYIGKHFDSDKLQSYLDAAKRLSRRC